MYKKFVEKLKHICVWSSNILYIWKFTQKYVPNIKKLPQLPHFRSMEASSDAFTFVV